jgi:hypothetical protein
MCYERREKVQRDKKETTTRELPKEPSPPVSERPTEENERRERRPEPVEV